MTETLPPKPAPVSFPAARTVLHPAPELAEYRSCPVRPFRYPEGDTGWLVTSHEHTRELLVSSSAHVFVRPPIRPFAEGDDPNAVGFEERPVHGEFDGDADRSDLPLFALNPPHHTRMRRAVAGRFSVKAAEALRPFVESTVEALLDDIEAGGDTADLVRDVAIPLAVQTTCHFLGLRDPSTWIHTGLDIGGADFKDGGEQFLARWDREVAWLRGHPNDGLLSHMLANESLSAAEVLAIGLEVVTAGQHTTVGAMGLGCAILLDEGREWWDRLGSDPGVAPAVVEELLRFTTVFHHGANTRVATEDFVLGDERIAAGDFVFASLSAANRDPRTSNDPTTSTPDAIPAPTWPSVSESISAWVSTSPDSNSRPRSDDSPRGSPGCGCSDPSSNWTHGTSPPGTCTA
jgi:cytochrome P450